MRDRIYAEVHAIEPFDALERDHRVETLAWIRSGAPLCRVQKPAIPPKHLVSYFVAADDGCFLLVDHLNAQLWLPTGGHVEPGEHPRATVTREAWEELGLAVTFLFDAPLMVTCTTTAGLDAGHVDVSLWYAVQGDRNQDLIYDRNEFNEIGWFDIDSIPYEKSDPHMKRFVEKFVLIQANHNQRG